MDSGPSRPARAVAGDLLSSTGDRRHNGPDDSRFSRRAPGHTCGGTSLRTALRGGGCLPAAHSEYARGWFVAGSRAHTQADHHAFPIYAEFLASLGMRHTASLSLREGVHSRDFLGLIRPVDMAQFSADEQALLEQLIPHIVRANRLRHRGQLRAAAPGRVGADSGGCREARGER